MIQRRLHRTETTPLTGLCDRNSQDRLGFNGAVKLYASLLGGLAIALGSCSDSDESVNLDPLASTTAGIFVQIAYMPGAEPYTGGSEQLDDYWSIARSNLEALFVDKAVRVPSTLADMSVLDAPGQESFTAQEIFDIARALPDERQDGEARFIAIWLDGFFEEEDGTVRRDVLGVALGGTEIVAMFKPVIMTSEIGRLPLVAAFVEQSTFVHELGHAVGLVNNGIPLTSDHHDEENGAHCTNRDCVMYYLNEGLADLRAFVQQYLDTSQTVLFGPECLDDVIAAQAN